MFIKYIQTHELTYYFQRNNGANLKQILVFCIRSFLAILFLNSYTCKINNTSWLEMNDKHSIRLVLPMVTENKMSKNIKSMISRLTGFSIIYVENKS
jgi:hypothetical protein